jgi:hypothetical protein
MADVDGDDDAVFMAACCLCPPVGLALMILDGILNKVTGRDLTERWKSRKAAEDRRADDRRREELRQARTKPPLEYENL